MSFFAPRLLKRLVHMTAVVLLSTAADGAEQKKVQLDPAPAEPIVLGPEINGSSDQPTIITVNADQPIMTGAQTITKWQTTRVNGHEAWVAELPDVRAGKWQFHQLFVNGERRFRPRLPETGFYRFSDVPDLDPKAGYRPGQKRVQYEQGHFNPEWKNQRDIEIVVLNYWVSPRMQIADVDPKKRLITFTQPTLRRLSDSFNVNQFARYYIDNVFEALDAPGEWYLDHEAGKLYYLPKPGETIENTRITAPRLPQLLRIEGTAEQPVEHVVLRGITFTGTEWYDADANAADRQASVGVPAVISLKHAKNITIEDSTVTGVGTYGIQIDQGCSDVTINNCRLTDLGAGGVKIWHGSRRSTLSNCVIASGGRLFHNAVGVLVGHSHENHVAHNLIHDFYYTGITVGWTWGYRTPSQASENIVEYNHIHHIGQGWLSDMAGVYTLGISPGTVVRNNLVHDIEADHYGGWGLYTDEGSSFIRFENNVVYRTTHGGFHQHYGSYNIIRNNIFAFSRHAMVQRTRSEPHTSFIFERNIVYSNVDTILDKNWSDDNFRLDYNTYWRTDNESTTFAGQSFEDWQNRGHDRHSIVADPKFADPSAGDFTLQEDSPALKQGFKPIDLSNVGPVNAKAE